MLGEFFIIKRRFRKRIRDIFANGNDKILDIGSGSNPYYHKLMKGRIVRFDIKKHRKLHVVGNADFLPFRDKSFDKVITINSLYYFSNPFKVTKRISEILKKSGKLFMITPFIYPIHDAPYDRYRFTEFGIRELLKNGFDVRNVEAIGGFFNLPAVMLHSLIKGMPLLAPKTMKTPLKVFFAVVLYPFYITAQLISLLDFLDKSKRWPTYYLTIAVKR